MRRPFGILSPTIAALCALAATAGGPARAGCPSLPGGTDPFPSTMMLVLDPAVFGEPYVVRLSSAGNPDAMLQRAPENAGVIDVEILQMDLTAFHPKTGSLALRQSPTIQSLGQIRDVQLDGGCQLSGGLLVLDLYFELDVGLSLETWFNLDPLHVEAPISGLPLQDVRLEVPLLVPVDLRDSVASDDRGNLLYGLHHADPNFPEPGADCSDAQLTADLFVFDPAQNTSLFGFGPSKVQRGIVSPGGTCNVGGGPCTDDGDCPALDRCVRQSVDTELVQMDLIGSDGLLGNWDARVLPGGGTSDCCVGNGTPGCTDAPCEDVICGADPFCCNVEWDTLCAGLASGEPTCISSCPIPDAQPTLGSVQSVPADRSYPADSSFDLFLEIDSNLQGKFRNTVAIPLEPTGPVTNLPVDPGTSYVYGGPPIVMFDGVIPKSQISNVAYDPQIPKDCEPPPGPRQTCFDVSMQVDLTLPGCSQETLDLAGQARVLRDAPVDSVGLGQETIATLLAGGTLAGTSPCAGAFTLRISSTETSTGTTESLTPEEFFPADSFFDAYFEIETGSGLLHTDDPARVTTTINALPQEGEAYPGTSGVVDLLDPASLKVGEIVVLGKQFDAEIVCPADGLPSIVFPGPTRQPIHIGLPDSGLGVEFDLVRGSLNALRAGGGSFASAICLQDGIGPDTSDSDDPPSADGFFYVARDGFGAFNGTWNGPGLLQQGNRDAGIGSCP